jgi:hypothetical protein
MKQVGDLYWLELFKDNLKYLDCYKGIALDFYIIEPKSFKNSLTRIYNARETMRRHSNYLLLPAMNGRMSGLLDQELSSQIQKR